MNQAAQDKLRELRQRLAELEPYPWEPVEAWIASAKPLIKAHYAEHFDSFVAEVATPKWSFARENATRTAKSRQHALAAKKKIAAFVDGLLDMPEVPQSGATSGAAGDSESAATRPKQADVSPSPAQGAARILFVDDDEALVRAFSRALQADNRYHVEFAPDGWTGEHLARTNTFDVIVTDIKMPGQNGYELLRAVKQFTPTTEVLVITGHESMEGAIQAMRLGACDYLTKPFDYDEFAVRVERALHSARMRRELLEARVELAAIRAQMDKSPSVSYHQYGNVVVKSTYNSNFRSSTLGAIAVGDHAQAVGAVTLGVAFLKQEQHRAVLKEAQKALVDDEDRLAAAVVEALERFLKQAREVQVEAKPFGEVQAEMGADPPLISAYYGLMPPA